ncbi:hypothetical protein XELAEV_18046828mg [Xenopus laevis]|uniref:Uncharacterized protein n=1 Tax=Xenopus laevis TaxID=8355 RepID=A0A974BU33_XENLA|nr:hypothetical protein XELAEV_18046828mg [Xenopus laevis]
MQQAIVLFLSSSHSPVLPNHPSDKCSRHLCCAPHLLTLLCPPNHPSDINAVNCVVPLIPLTGIMCRAGFT